MPKRNHFCNTKCATRSFWVSRLLIFSYFIRDPPSTTNVTENQLPATEVTYGNHCLPQHNQTNHILFEFIQAFILQYDTQNTKYILITQNTWYNIDDIDTNDN